MSARVAPVTELQRRNHTHRIHSPGKTTISMLLLLLMAAYFFMPLYWLIVSSTKSTGDLFTTPILEFPGHLNLMQNLHALTAYQGGIYWRWFLNSIIYAGGTSILATFISAMAGYALAKYTFRFQSTILRVVVAGLTIPIAALTIPIFLLVKEMGLINTYAGVILPMLVNPFGVYFLSVYIRGAMPTELLDSGRVDGASDFRIFWSIAAPIIRPGLITFFLISFIAIWNNFFLPLVVLSNPKLFPVTLGLDVLVGGLTSGNGQPMYSVIMLGSVLCVLPMLILFPWLRKYISSGLSIGSVKG